MRPLIITAMTVVSAMGRGAGATLDALQSRRGGLRPSATDSFGYLGVVDAVDEHRLPDPLACFDCRNNRLADLALRTDNFTHAVERARRRYGADRIAVVLGTSTSGILSTELAYATRSPESGDLPPDYNYENTHDMFSLARFVRAALELRGPALVVSTACASSAKSFVDARHLIDSGICDAAVVGGADSLCRMTLHGFASLELIAPTACRPCGAQRDGISVGEAAGFALLERDGSGVALLGYGASSDGYHMSAPHPQGTGAMTAMRDALACAGLAPHEIDYVNLHGTGTKANDAIEDLAVAAVFGSDVPCSSTKGWSGHALGAAGVLEAVIAVLCIRNHLIPGCLNVTTLDPTFQARTLVENASKPVRRVMSNSFGFGGINCSLIFGQLE
jgi:3-oxoacyl-[acyl-carrier-protein] synthase-1